MKGARSDAHLRLMKWEKVAVDLQLRSWTGLELSSAREGVADRIDRRGGKALNLRQHAFTLSTTANFNVPLASHA